jgi:hypothetical protein
VIQFIIDSLEISTIRRKNSHFQTGDDGQANFSATRKHLNRQVPLGMELVISRVALPETDVDGGGGGEGEGNSDSHEYRC